MKLRIWLSNVISIYTGESVTFYRDFLVCIILDYYMSNVVVDTRL